MQSIPSSKFWFIIYLVHIVLIPFLLWAIHNTPNFRIVIGFFEQNLAKTISVYVHKSNDLRRLPKVIFIENFCYWSLQQQWQKTATWRSQQLSAWIFYPIFVSNAKSQVFRSFFLGYVRNILHFCWVYANLATEGS